MDAVTVEGGDAADTINIDAEELEDGDLLTLEGTANITVNNLLGNITSSAVGTIQVNLDRDGLSGTAQTTTITSSTAISIDADGVLGTEGFTDNGVITLADAGAKTLTDLVANVTAAGSSGTVDITTKNVADNLMSITTGSGAMTVTGLHSSDTITVDADEIPDDVVLTLDGDSHFRVTNLTGDVAAGALDGTLRVTIDPAGTNSTIVGGTTINDTVEGSDAGDVLVLTAIESVDAGIGDDNITITDDDLRVIDLNNGTNTLTFEDGNAVDNFTVTGGSGSDTVNAELNSNLTLTFDADFTEVETFNVMDIDEGDDAFDATIILSSAFSNGNNIVFSAFTLDAGEQLTFNASAYTGTDAITVVGGAGNDLITTAETDAQRDLMTINLSAGGNDTVRILNGGSVIVSDLVDVDTVGGDETDQFGGTVLDGFFASPEATNQTGPVILGSSSSASGDDITVTVDDNDDGAKDDLYFTGTNSDTNTEWKTAGSDGVVEPGKSFVTIENFTAGAGTGFDTLNIDWVTSGGTVVNMSGAAFFNNVVLNSTILSGATNGSVIEISSDTFQLSDYTNLEAVAGLLSNNGAGNALFQLASGNYSVVLYDDDGTGLISDAYIYNITVDQGDGLDFESNEPSTGNFNYDADSIELVAVLTNVQSDALTGNNFIA